MALVIIFLTVLSGSIVSNAQEDCCFVLETSQKRREYIGFVEAQSEESCKFKCAGDESCKATLLNDEKSGCVILGDKISEPVKGKCTAPYSSLVKTTSGCTEAPEMPTSQGYIPHECLQAGDVIGDLVAGGSVLCVSDSETVQRRLIIDAVQHDGTHIVLESGKYNTIGFDQYMQSWYYKRSIGTNRIYFKSAKCVTAPQTDPTTKCACAPPLTAFPFPDDGYNYFDPTTPLIDVSAELCKGKVFLITGPTFNGSSHIPPMTRRLSCYLGTWIMSFSASPPFNPDSTILGATCYNRTKL